MKDECFKYKDIVLELVAEETRLSYRDSDRLQNRSKEVFQVQKFKGRCHISRKVGHTRKDCYYRKDANASSSFSPDRRS